MAEKIIILGRRSSISHAVVEELQSNGYEVLTISSAELVPENAHELALRIDGAYAICNTVGVPYVAKWSDRYVHDIYCSRMLSIRSIVEAFRYCNILPKAFVHVSNAMVYDEYEVHDEFSTQYTDSFVAEVGLMETKEMLKVGKKYPDIRLAIIRSGYLMYSKGGLFPIMRRICRSRMSSYLGDGFQCLPLIHLKDAARAIAMVTTLPEAVGVVNLTIPQMASFRELVDSFQKHAHKRFLIPLPEALIRLFAGRAIAMLEQNCKVIPHRLEAIGFKFQYPDVDSIIADLY